MIGALLAKELRQLAPLTALMLVIALSNIVYLPLVMRPDEVTWLDTGEMAPGQGVGTAAALIVLALVTGYSLFCREHDEGTIEFLRSLPVTRRAVYLVKIAAGAIVLCGGMWLGLVVDWLLTLFNHQSFSGEQFRASIALRLGFLFGCVCIVGLSHAVVLSYFRRFGVLVYGIAWWAVLTVTEIDRSLEFLNPLRIAELEYRGHELVLPWRALRVHLGLAVVAFLAGYALWSTAGESWSAAYRRLAARWWGRGLLLAASAGILALVWTLFVRVGSRLEPLVLEPVRYEPFSVASASTAHYRFTYPSGLAETAGAVVAAADEAYAGIVAELGAAPGPPVVVDMTDRSVEHAGIAGWQKIRMDIRGHSRLDEHLHVLHHETVHVVVAHESGRELSRRADAATFFVEGIAEHVALRVRPRPAVRRQQRLVGALSWRRQGIDFDELIDASGFGARFNWLLVYTLGELWVQGLADACGDAAPGRVVRAAGRAGRPRDLSRRAFWQDALQAAGCELESANDAWRRRMEQVLDAQRAAARAMPALSAGVSRRERGDIVIAVLPDRALDDPGRVRLRVRASLHAAEGGVHTLLPRASAPGDGPIEVLVPERLVDAGGFWVQPGYQLSGPIQSYYEPWRRMEVGPASGAR